MVSDRALSIATLSLFIVSTVFWIGSFGTGLVAASAGALSTMGAGLVVLTALTRYAALVTGIVAVFRTNRWSAGTPWLVSNWVIVAWYGLLFLRDVIILIVVLTFTGMGSGGAMGGSLGHGI